MNSEVKLLVDAFKRHLEAKGLDRDFIPSFLRDLEGAITESREVRLVNRRLHLLGWNDLDVDYRTMELAEAYFDSGYFPYRVQPPDVVRPQAGQ